MKTVTPVIVMADLVPIETGDDVSSRSIKRRLVRPLTITIEDGMLTIGTHNGPDMWRAELKDLMKEEDDDE